MAIFFTTSGCSHQLEDLITNARESLYLVSPYLQISPILIERLQEAEKRQVRIVVVYGKERERQVREIAQLARIGRFELRFMQNLHAKCYATEAGMLITSMNLYEYSARNNREMGVFLTSQEEAYKDAWRELESIIACATVDTMSPAQMLLGAPSAAVPQLFEPMRRQARKQTQSKPRRFCLRCRERILANPERPLCRECFETWGAFGNADYPEAWCHTCGADAATSMARPLCGPCYRSGASVGTEV